MKPNRTINLTEQQSPTEMTLFGSQMVHFTLQVDILFMFIHFSASQHLVSLYDSLGLPYILGVLDSPKSHPAKTLHRNYWR